MLTVFNISVVSWTLTPPRIIKSNMCLVNCPEPFQYPEKNSLNSMLLDKKKTLD